MNQYSYAQLYANKVLDIPLPMDADDGYCRECGGPIQTGTAREKNICPAGLTKH